VPPVVVTVTSTVPVPGGDVAVIEVLELTVKLVASVEPNLTVLAPLKLVPVIVTMVPPASGPLLGLTPVTVGAGVGTAKTHAAPTFVLSPGPPITAVVAVEDKATLRPKSAAPEPPVPLSFDPTCAHVEPERWNWKAAPSDPSSP
jgi:hypothetical protein